MVTKIKYISLLIILLFFSCKKLTNQSVLEIVEYKKGVTTKSYTETHTEALQYCKQQDFNTDYYFLLDFRIHPGKNRFFVYNFKTQKIDDKQLVAHGTCDVFDANPNQEMIAKFSNQNDSHCSSKGKFQIGKRAYSNWGINVKYWLKGLDKTNNNAQDRIVVLHSWENIPDNEVYPNPIALSWGCPAVSNKFMKQLDAKIKKSKNQSVLLWIIN